MPSIRSIGYLVCQRHFAPSDILRETTAFDEATGRMLSARLEVPKLRNGAVPSILPNCPTYLSSSTTSRESPDERRNRREEKAIKTALARSIADGGRHPKLPRLGAVEGIATNTIYDTSRTYENGIGNVYEVSMGKALPIFHMLNPETVRGNTAAPQKNHANGEASQVERRCGANQDPLDEFDLFGKSVAAQLRQLSLSRALRAQTTIQSFLRDEHLRDLELTMPPTEHLPIVSETNIGGSGTPGWLLVPEPSVLGGSSSIVPQPVVLSSSSAVVSEPSQVESDDSWSSSFHKQKPNFKAIKVESDDSRSSSFHKQKPNFKAIKAECDDITLEEHDPFEGC